MSTHFVKHYDDGKKTTETLFNQLRIYIKNNNKSDDRMNIIDVCEDMIHNTDTQTRNAIIYNFHKIIRETCMYFKPLNSYQKNYYREFFAKKLYDKYFAKIEKHITDKKMLTHFKCLFVAFLRSNINTQFTNS